jgi:hypothetical protein
VKISIMHIAWNTKTSVGIGPKYRPFPFEADGPQWETQAVHLSTTKPSAVQENLVVTCNGETARDKVETEEEPIAGQHITALEQRIAEVEERIGQLGSVIVFLTESSTGSGTSRD